MILHMDLEIFLKIFTPRKYRSEDYLTRVYSYIVTNWKNPLSFYSNFNEIIQIKYRKEVKLYFSALGIYRGIRVPTNVLIKIPYDESMQVLKILLKDYDRLMKIIEEKKRINSSRDYIETLYYLVYKISSFYGKNEYKDIDEKMILDKKILKIFDRELAVTYRLLDLRYHMGYSEVRAKDIIWREKKELIELEKKEIGYNLKKLLNEYKDVISNHMVISQVKQKLRYLEVFFIWLKDKFSLTSIDNLDMITREVWLLFISYICDTESCVNKTKNSKLLSVVQFIEWLKIVHPSLIDESVIIERNDYKKLTDYENSTNSLAFKSSNDVRRILNFLTYEYKAKDLYEEFYIAAIIIAANSGMRRSEISDMEYGSVKYDDDTKLYIINHNVVDKLGVKNRAIYITEIAYIHIKKIMNIRKNNDILTKRNPRKGGEAYIHLFEFKSSDVLYSPKFDDFMIKINNILNIEKREGEVEAGLHGYRHYFATEVFKASGYDISTVKYLLRHKSYSMTLHYLSQEREKEIVKSREYLEEDNKYEGLGVEKIVNIMFFEKKYENFALDKKVINASKNLSELIKATKMKKLPIGYCINPCENASKCFKCNNFLIEKREIDKLLRFAKEQSEIVSLKIYLLKQSFTESEVQKKVKEDIEDLIIIIRELEGLGVTKDKISYMLMGESYQ